MLFSLLIFCSQSLDKLLIICVLVFIFTCFDTFSGTPTPPTPPTLFPLVQCQPGSGDKITVGCFARDFYPKSLTFQWTDASGTTLTSENYPPAEKNNKYTGVSLVKVSKSDWDSRKSFKCSVNHNGSPKNLQVQSMWFFNLLMPLISYQYVLLIDPAFINECRTIFIPSHFPLSAWNTQHNHLITLQANDTEYYRNKWL